MDPLMARVFETAAAIGLPLDKEFSCIQTMENGTVSITASVDSFPKTNEERSISQSALHAALLEDFADIDNVDVRVFLPPVAGETAGSTPNNVVLASQTIRSWNAGVNDFAVSAALQFALSSYNCVVDTYPWVEQRAMRARISVAVQQMITNMKTGLSDPLMTNECVDYILPPIQSVVRDEEFTNVYHDVIRVLGDTPGSILQFYEVIYLCGTQQMAVSDTTLSVFRRVFRV
jgi:hypothetical protein